MDKNNFKNTLSYSKLYNRVLRIFIAKTRSSTELFATLLYSYQWN